MRTLGVMTPELPHTDAELDILWRALTGQPLPISGAPEIAKALLAEHLKKGDQARSRNVC